MSLAPPIAAFVLSTLKPGRHATGADRFPPRRSP
jgi:hypothetical protein